MLDVEKLTGKVPDALLTRPKLLEHQAFYFNIYLTLSDWRGYLGTGDVAPITLQDILTYCQMFGLESHELRSNLLKHIKRLDTAYMLRRMEQQEDKPKDAAEGEES